jgi:UPF0176 protein
MPNQIVVAALYQFTPLHDLNNLKQTLYTFCQKHLIKGTVLIAPEGINGTVSGTRTSIDALKKRLEQERELQALNYKESFCTTDPFLRLKIKLKKEIVTLGDTRIDPLKTVGTYVDATEWNALINDPDVLVLDTRNDYETNIGHFQNAHIPNTQVFREFPEYVRTQLKQHKKTKVAMYCTGGIRCEKASSFMLDEGFETVYHLKGGILKYLEETSPTESLWQGACFVFDERVALDAQLKPDTYTQCYGCRHPLTPEEAEDLVTIKGVCCPHCHTQTSPEQKSRFAEREKQMQLSKARGQTHLAHEN